MYLMLYFTFKLTTNDELRYYMSVNNLTLQVFGNY